MGVLRQDGLTSSDSAPSTRNVQRIPLAEPVNLDISYKKLSIRLLSLYLLAVIRDPDSERTCQLAALFKEKYIEGISVGRHSLKPFEDLDSEQAHFVGEIVSDSIREFPGFLGKDGDQEVVQAALESMVSVARFTSNAKKNPLPCCIGLNIYLPLDFQKEHRQQMQVIPPC